MGKQRNSALLTTRVIQALRPRQSVSESLGYGAGALEAQGSQRGARFFFRYGKPQRRVALPAFNVEGEPLSLAEAREQARSLSARFRQLRDSGRGDLAEVLETERLESERSRQSDGTGPTTLNALMSEYARWLELRGKTDFRPVRRTVENHLTTPFPEIAGKEAGEVTLDDVLLVLQRLIASGKLRTAQKMRAYLRAAYGAAINSRFSAQASELRRFDLSVNPAALVAAVEDASRPRDRVLSVEELRALWRRLNETEETLGC